MSSKILHGDPGSYKSSSAVYYEILPALKAGRTVVTNVEGICPIEKFAEIFDCTFPDSARLIRISTLKEKGANTIKRWFQWLPVGALIVIDEVQNTYNCGERKDFVDLNYNLPDGVEFKSVDMIETFRGALPDDFVNYSISNIENVVDDGYTDDSGESDRDSNGHILYPRNIKDAMMRHRKFNWDIVVCTPDISQVHSLIRQTSEVAYRFVSFDFMPFPYFQQRPRYNEHNAQEKGYPIKKGQLTNKRKIPLETFKLYKSTQTGETTKSGQSDNPLKSFGIVAGFVLILSVLAYQVYWWSRDEAPAQPALDTSSTGGARSGSKASGQTGDVGSRQSSGSVSFDNRSQTSVQGGIPDVLEMYQADEIYLTGVVKQLENHRVQAYEFYFNMLRNGKEFSITGGELLSMGYQIFYRSNCSVMLVYNDTRRFIFCPPTEILEPDYDSHEQSSEPQLVAGVADVL